MISAQMQFLLPETHTMNLTAVKMRCVLCSGLLVWNSVTPAMAQPVPRAAAPAYLPKPIENAFLGVGSDPAEEGAVVTQVVPGSAAQAIGLEQRDVIVALDGFPVGVIHGTTYTVASEIRRSGPEVEITIRDFRTGNILTRVARVGGQSINKGNPVLFPRLGIESNLMPEGEVIVSIAAGSPAAAAGLQIGDRIAAVDGYPIGVVEGNTYSLASEIRHASRRCRLEVVRNGGIGHLFVDFGPKPILTQRVHALVIGLTDDPKIGRDMRLNLDGMQNVLRAIPPQHRGAMLRIDGQDCQPANILRSIQMLNVQPNDALFVYYGGHGAFDPNRIEPNDPSGAHFFSIPGQDLMRRDLMRTMLSKQARLTLLISDTCNVSAPANLPGRAAAVQMAPQQQPQEPPVVSLLLRHRGILDVSGSSRGQYGWGSEHGGIFTVSLVRAMTLGGTNWSAVLDQSKRETHIHFAEIQRIASTNPQAMPPEAREAVLSQPDQAPQAFVFRLWMD